MRIQVENIAFRIVFQINFLKNFLNNDYGDLPQHTYRAVSSKDTAIYYIYMLLLMIPGFVQSSWPHQLKLNVHSNLNKFEGVSGLSGKNGVFDVPHFQVFND